MATELNKIVFFCNDEILDGIERFRYKERENTSGKMQSRSRAVVEILKRFFVEKGYLEDKKED